MNQDRIWEAYQNDPELMEMGCRDGGRLDFFSEVIPNSVRVLNIGAGHGNLEAQLLEKGADVHSLDPSETSIRSLQERLGLGDKAKVGYSQDIPFPQDYFDYVVMTEVVEHLSDDVLVKTLGEVNRVLKPQGTFVGSVPADENLIDGMVVCPHCGERFHRWGHQQSFSESGLREILERSFKTVMVKRVVFFDFDTLNWKGRIDALLRRFQARLGWNGSNQSFYFRAEKR